MLLIIKDTMSYLKIISQKAIVFFYFICGAIISTKHFIIDNFCQYFLNQNFHYALIEIQKIFLFCFF